MHPSRPHLFRAAALALALAAGTAASAPLDFLFAGGTPPASERVVDGVQRIWKTGEYSALRLAARTEPSAPNAQPLVLDSAALQAALQAVQFESAPGVWKPLFAASDLPDISQALAKALALATPQDDVLLMASARYDGALLGLQRSVLARLFVGQGAVNLLVYVTRADLLSSYRASYTLPLYDFGSRQAASASKIAASGAQQLRADWLALDLSGKPRSAAPLAQTTALSAPAAAQPAVAPAPAATAPRDKAFFEQQAQRLEGLKSLLDKGLISNAEYQQKRSDILQSL